MLSELPKVGRGHPGRLPRLRPRPQGRANNVNAITSLYNSSNTTTNY